MFPDAVLKSAQWFVEEYCVPSVSTFVRAVDNTLTKATVPYVETFRIASMLPSIRLLQSLAMVVPSVMTISYAPPRMSAEKLVAGALAAFRTISQALGLLSMDVGAFVDEVKDKRLGAMGLDRAFVEERLAARAQARADRDWARADAIRASRPQRFPPTFHRPCPYGASAPRERRVQSAPLEPRPASMIPLPGARSSLPRTLALLLLGALTHAQGEDEPTGWILRFGDDGPRERVAHAAFRLGADESLHPAVEPEFGEQVHVASVTLVDRVIDAASGTFGARLELPNPDHSIPGGLHCQVHFVEE